MRLVAERHQLASPMMRRSAGLEPDKVGGQRSKKLQQLVAPDRLGDHNMPRSINAAWFSSERTPTNRIEGRVTASQIAAASDASFFCRRI